MVLVSVFHWRGRCFAAPHARFGSLNGLTRRISSIRCLVNSNDRTASVTSPCEIDRELEAKIWVLLRTAVPTLPRNSIPAMPKIPVEVSLRLPAGDGRCIFWQESFATGHGIATNSARIWVQPHCGGSTNGIRVRLPRRVRPVVFSVVPASNATPNGPKRHLKGTLSQAAG